MPSAAVLLSLVCSAIYTSTFELGKFPGRWIIKTASIALFAYVVRRYPILALALLFGALGDALLDLSSQLFVAGLIAFLCGHIVYTICFTRTGVEKHGRGPLIGLALFSAIYLAWLWPSLGAMRLPVIFYVGAITVMAITSFRVGGWVAIGAILFLLSDSLLAANRFKAPIPLRDYLIWFTYYFGQMAIALGYLRSRSAIAATKPAMV